MLDRRGSDLPAAPCRAFAAPSHSSSVSSVCSAAPKPRTTPRTSGSRVTTTRDCCRSVPASSCWASVPSRCGDPVGAPTTSPGGTRGGRCYVLAALLVAGFILFPISLTYVVTHVAPADVPAANLGAPYEDVQFTTSDGYLLKGWYVPSRNRAAVISFPGRSGTRLQARMLARHGYGVLLFDRRGEGESEGDWNVFGWQGERDLHAAVAFLQSRTDVDPERIGGIGRSVGGEMLIGAAAESDAFKAIVSEGGSSRSVRDDVANYGWGVSQLSAYALSSVQTAATAVFTNNLPPEAMKDLAPKISPRAAFFIYGEHGQGGTEETPNRGFYAAAGEPKELWEVPGAQHVGGITTQPEEYERRVIAFFDQALRD